MTDMAPTPTTINELFAQAIERHRHKPDLLNYKSGGWWVHVSAEQLWRDVRSYALGFYALGVRPRDHVALLSENRIEWTLADLALLALGAVSVPLHATQAVGQIEFVLRDSGARWLVLSTADQYSRIRDALRRNEAIERIVTFDQMAADDDRLLSFSSLREEGEKVSLSQPHLYDELRRSVRPDDVATLLYTSGTTGEPKGVILTHANITTNVLASLDVLMSEGEETVLSVLPLSHSFERQAFYCHLCRGSSIYYAESLDKVGDNLREVRPTMLVGVPRMFEKMQEKIIATIEALPERRRRLLRWALSVARRWAELKSRRQPIDPLLEVQYDAAAAFLLSKIKRAAGLDRLRSMISGGASLWPETALFFFGLGIEIFQGYGLTETSPVVSVNPPGANKIGTVGKPIPGVEVKIADDGEILVRGPNVMKGYYNRPDETAASFTPDGWFKTGDIGYLDEDGYLVITDRKKDLIKTSGGKYVSPQMLEGLLVSSPLISQAVVVGNERKFPAALIVPQMDLLRRRAAERGISVNHDEELIAHPQVIALVQEEVDRLMQDVSSYERIKKIALLPAPLTIEGGELTPTLKARRRVIETKYRDVIDALYQES